VPETAAAAPLQAAPGSRFNYANNDALLAIYSLMPTLGPESAGFPHQPQTDHAASASRSTG
jgi:hypothetical protein